MCPPGNKQGLATREAAGGAVASMDAAFGPAKMALQSRVDELYSHEYFGGLEHLANAAAASRLFGESSREQLFMVLMTGRELGIAPTVALRNIGVFKGKTVISSQLQLAKVKDAGYKAEIMENTPTKATVRLTSKDGVVYEKSFTMEDAKLAGLPERNALYRTIPATMLLNRAIGLVCRYGAPEVMNGLYNDSELDELEDVPGASAAGGSLGTTTYTQDAVVNGWDIPAQEEFADLMDKVYQVFKATGHADDYTEFEARWKKNKSTEPAESVLKALRERVAKLLTTPGAAAPTAPAVASGPPPAPTAPPLAPTAPSKPVPVEPAKPINGWTTEDSAKFEDLVAKMRGLSPKAGEDEGKAQHRINFYYQERDKGVAVASLLEKMSGSVKKLEAQANKMAAPPPPPPPPAQEELADPDEEVNPYSLMDPQERTDLMTNLWATINGKLGEQGVKSTKAAKECQRLFEEWTAGLDPDDTAAVEAAVVLGQEKWLRNA